MQNWKKQIPQTRITAQPQPTQQSEVAKILPTTPQYKHYEAETLRSIVSRVGGKATIRLLSIGATFGFLLAFLVMLIFALLTAHQIR